MPETCRVLWQNKFWVFDASSWLFYTKLVTMQGPLNIKISDGCYVNTLWGGGEWDLFKMVPRAGVSYYCLKFRVCYCSITNAGHSNINETCPITCQAGSGWGTGVAPPIPDSGARNGWVVNTTLRPLFPLGKRPGWVGFGASLDGFGKFRLRRVSNLGPCSLMESLYLLCSPGKNKVALKWEFTRSGFILLVDPDCVICRIGTG